MASQSVSVSHPLTRSVCAALAAVWRGLYHWIRSVRLVLSKVWIGDIPRLDTQHPLQWQGPRSSATLSLTRASIKFPLHPLPGPASRCVCLERACSVRQAGSPQVWCVSMFRSRTFSAVDLTTKAESMDPGSSMPTCISTCGIPRCNRSAKPSRLSPP